MKFIRDERTINLARPITSEEDRKAAFREVRDLADEVVGQIAELAHALCERARGDGDDVHLAVLAERVKTARALVELLEKVGGMTPADYEGEPDNVVHLAPVVA